MEKINGKFVRKLVTTRMACALIVTVFCFASMASGGQQAKIVWTPQQKSIITGIRSLRSLPDEKRGQTTRELALKIRQLPGSANKVRLAYDLASLSTEGDFGSATLQEVGTTLAQSLRETPPDKSARDGVAPYEELATLVRYEHVQASLEDARFAAAMKKLEEEDARHQQVDFTLPDLQGKNWSMNELRGKIVLVNFWATWCPPCRSEMPDLQKLYTKYKEQGLVVLSISDEEMDKVSAYVKEYGYSYPVLLDAGRKVNDMFGIRGIPKSFVYDREGKLVAQAMDMRTERQFMGMLEAAGLK
jgi:peroxiredoxin